jgi:hypothetical protein
MNANICLGIWRAIREPEGEHTEISVPLRVVIIFWNHSAALVMEHIRAAGSEFRTRFLP